MKFIFKILTITLVLFTIQSITIKKLKVGMTEDPAEAEQKKTDALTSAIFQSDVQKLWEKIFKDVDRKKCAIANKKGKVADKKTVTVGGITAAVPLKRENFYSKLEIGYGSSAYFFDYIDELLLDDVTKKFEEVMKIIEAYPKEDKEYEDPYTLNKMLSVPLENSPPVEELIARLTKAYPSFDKDYWEKSFNAVQLRKAFIENKWDVPIGITDPAKRIIDRFDFNGDGRLSQYETIIAIIDTNKGIYGRKKCKNCFEELQGEYFDPIFMFSNLDNDDKLTSEEMWRAFEYLNRKTTKFNIYLCKVDGQGVRTSSLNDFILKSQRVYNGSLTKREFSIGILIGYWGRQVDKSQIYKAGEKNRKGERWSDPDAADNACISS